MDKHNILNWTIQISPLIHRNGWGQILMRKIVTKKRASSTRWVLYGKWGNQMVPGVSGVISQFCAHPIWCIILEDKGTRSRTTSGEQSRSRKRKGTQYTGFNFLRNDEEPLSMAWKKQEGDWRCCPWRAARRSRRGCRSTSKRRPSWGLLASDWSDRILHPMATRAIFLPKQRSSGTRGKEIK
jgi:hypothetical protein